MLCATNGYQTSCLSFYHESFAIQTLRYYAIF